MTLSEFIAKVALENDLKIDTRNDSDCIRYIERKAKDKAEGRSSIGIDDETIRQWILDYVNEESKVNPKEEAKKDTKEVVDEEKAKQLALF